MGSILPQNLHKITTLAYNLLILGKFSGKMDPTLTTKPGFLMYRRFDFLYPRLKFFEPRVGPNMRRWTHKILGAAYHLGTWGLK